MAEYEDKYEDNFVRLQKVADEMGIILNPNEARVQRVIGKMTHHLINMGENVCPCKQTTPHPSPGEEILCPCEDLAEEIRRDGKCHCRLFYSKDHPSAKGHGPAQYKRSIDEYPVVC